MLTDTQCSYLAAKGSWTIEVQYHDLSDLRACYRTCGDGVDDINSMARLMTANPNWNYFIDLGGISERMFPLVLADMVTFRAAYIAVYHAELNRPNQYSDPAPGDVMPTVPFAAQTYLPNDPLIKPVAY